VNVFSGDESIVVAVKVVEEGIDLFLGISETVLAFIFTGNGNVFVNVQVNEFFNVQFSSSGEIIFIE